MLERTLDVFVAKDGSDAAMFAFSQIFIAQPPVFARVGGSGQNDFHPQRVGGGLAKKSLSESNITSINCTKR